MVVFLFVFKVNIPKPDSIGSRMVSFHMVQRKVEQKNGRKKPESFAAAVLHTAPEPAWNKEESIHHCCLMAGICYMSTTPPGFNPHIINGPAAWASVTKRQRSTDVGV